MPNVPDKPTSVLMCLISVGRYVPFSTSIGIYQCEFFKYVSVALINFTLSLDFTLVVSMVSRFVCVFPFHKWCPVL